MATVLIVMFHWTVLEEANRGCNKRQNQMDYRFGYGFDIVGTK
jgi:hypothetical protein